jgi:hypothetical protein
MAACVKIIVLWKVTLCNLVDLPTFLKDLLPQYLKMEIVRHFKTYVHARILKLEAACSSDELGKFLPDRTASHFGYVYLNCLLHLSLPMHT